MSNIEPTEEHRRAAVMHHYKYAVLPDKGYLTDWVRTGDATNREDVFAVVIALARLLAEREAKLEEHIKWLETQCVSFEDANINNQKTIKALNEENQRYCEQVAIEKRHWSNLNRANAKTEAEADTLRARVAELEKSLGSRIVSEGELGLLLEASERREAELESEVNDTRQELQMVLDDWNSMVRAIQAPANGVAVLHAKQLVQREAQHLADAQKRETQHLAHIKALHQFLGDHEEEEGIWIPRSEFKDVPCRRYLAHYDDAKAADFAVIALEVKQATPDMIRAAATTPYLGQDDAKADAGAVDWQAWANGTCPETGCSLANPHEQGVACVKPTEEGGEG